MESGHTEALISFKEWVVGETFFEDLVDGSAREVKVENGERSTYKF